LKVFLDANILFSAAKADGAVRALLRLLLDNGHELWVDAYVVGEARRNLDIKDPETVATLDALLTHLKTAPIAAPGSETRASQWLPAEDRPVLEAAIRARCERLVTGDRTHFGAGYAQAFEGVTIASPRMLADELLPPQR
jgi:predicted nucleic acid-binding protein